MRMGTIGIETCGQRPDKTMRADAEQSVRRWRLPLPENPGAACVSDGAAKHHQSH
jgi:hypothetical protein